MKKCLALCAVFAMIISLVGCGSSAAPTQISETAVPSAEEPAEMNFGQIDMLYYLNLGGGSIMAACYTPEGIDRLGQDYYVVHVGAAEIYNASGEKITLEELTRGCPIRVTWPGMVMESYPGQIAAETVTALSDEADPTVPPEDEIQPFGDGPRWWVPEPVTEVPNLTAEYRNDQVAAAVILKARCGAWSYADAEGSELSGGAENARLDGLTPQEWDYDDRNTIQRSGFDTLTLTLAPEAQELQVMAYAYGTAEDAGTEVEISEDGAIPLLDGDTIYVVTARWGSVEYQGYAVYGFLVTNE